MVAENFLMTVIMLLVFFFIDFTKAFETVDYEILLYKMNTCGI